LSPTHPRPGLTEAHEIEKYFDRLWPIARSITGNGVRESLSILSEIYPLNVHEVPSGTKVFDWEIPREWNITDAYIVTPDKKKICRFRENNLHVVGYSIPVNKEVSWEDLEPRLHSLPDQPDAIPYITSYYKEDWGFCITEQEKSVLPRTGTYRVVIASELKNGSLTLADVVLPGRSKKEVLFSCYCCHPSMANNELSGLLLNTFLCRAVSKIPDRKYTYRFVFVPETIGSIAYLHEHGMHLKNNLLAGYVLNCCGTRANITYKNSARENSLADRLARLTLMQSGKKHHTRPFEPVGSDERQYCSPGFDLPVGSFMTSVYHEYPEYHTSLDNKSIMSFEAMNELKEVLLHLVRQIESAIFLSNTVAFGEPQLGKRGLYASLAKSDKFPDALRLRMRALNFFNGERSTAEFCEKYGYDPTAVEAEVSVLVGSGLLTRVDHK
jgi:aminopeptidase-like protein